jgi:hypothetical protein
LQEEEEEEEEGEEVEPMKLPVKKKETNKARLNEDPPVKKKRASKVRVLLFRGFYGPNYFLQGSAAVEPPKKKSKATTSTRKVSIGYVLNDIQLNDGFQTAQGRRFQVERDGGR